MSRHGPPGDHSGHHSGHLFESPEAAAFAELEAEVLAGFVAEGVGLLHGLGERDGLDVRRVLDLGSGPGVGTCALAERFPAAQVVAVDGSEVMLERASARARRRGVADQVTVERLDLTAGVAGLGRADAVWASMSLHHVGDQAAVLRGLRDLLAPGGLLALVERAEPLRVHLGDGAGSGSGGADAGRPGLWDRVDAAAHVWFDAMRAELPGATDDDPSHDAPDAYARLLVAAGFEVLVDRLVTVALEAPLDPDARRFARHHLERTSHQLQGFAAAADLDAVDALVARLADEGGAGGAGNPVTTPHGGPWAGATIHAVRRLILARPA